MKLPINTRTAIPTTVAFSVVNHWFSARRALATGIVTVGSALGGVFFSLVLQALFKQFDWTTSIALLSTVLCAFMAVGNGFVRTNTGSAPSHAGSLDLSCLRSGKFWLLTSAMFGQDDQAFASRGRAC